MINNKLYNLDDTLTLTRTDIIDLHNKYLNSSLVKLFLKIDFTRQFVKAEGTQVWDSEGKEYIDFLANQPLPLSEIVNFG